MHGTYVSSHSVGQSAVCVAMKHMPHDSPASQSASGGTGGGGTGGGDGGGDGGDGGSTQIVHPALLELESEDQVIVAPAAMATSEGPVVPLKVLLPILILS